MSFNAGEKISAKIIDYGTIRLGYLYIEIQNISDCAIEILLLHYKSAFNVICLHLIINDWKSYSSSHGGVKLKEQKPKHLVRRDVLKKSVMAVPMIHAFHVSELHAAKKSEFPGGGNTGGDYPGGGGGW